VPLTSHHAESAAVSNLSGVAMAAARGLAKTRDVRIVGWHGRIGRLSPAREFGANFVQGKFQERRYAHQAPLHRDEAQMLKFDRDPIKDVGWAVRRHVRSAGQLLRLVVWAWAAQQHSKPSHLAAALH
jgi:hypothetical protein